jgi:hypothetical protein
MDSLVLNDEPINVFRVSLSTKCHMLQTAPKFFSKSDRVESGVPSDSLRLFVGAVAEMNGRDLRDLSQLCNEFSFMEFAKTVGNWQSKRSLADARIGHELFFTACQLILLDVLPKGSKFNQQYFIDYVIPDLKTENQNFRCRMPPATFWVQTDNSTCRNGSKVVSKFDKHHIARLLHPPYSPDLSPCDFWLFVMLKGILKDREFPREPLWSKSAFSFSDLILYSTVILSVKSSINRNLVSEEER